MFFDLLAELLDLCMQLILLVALGLAFFIAFVEHLVARDLSGHLRVFCLHLIVLLIYHLSLALQHCLCVTLIVQLSLQTTCDMTTISLTP